MTPRGGVGRALIGLLVGLVVALGGGGVAAASATTSTPSVVYRYGPPAELRTVHVGSNEHLGWAAQLSAANGRRASWASNALRIATEDEPSGQEHHVISRRVAEAMGYAKTNFRSHGQPVYKNGRSYISRDVDGHCGGVWKEASSPEALGSKDTRNGTFNADLTVRVSD